MLITIVNKGRRARPRKVLRGSSPLPRVKLGFSTSRLPDTPAPPLSAPLPALRVTLAAGGFGGSSRRGGQAFAAGGFGGAGVPTHPAHPARLTLNRTTNHPASLRSAGRFG